MENIVVGIMAVIIVGAGIFGWWTSRVDDDDDKKEDK